MIGHGVNVLDTLGRARACRRAAHPLAEGDRVAGGLALEGAQAKQFRLALQIEAGPVQVGDFLHHKGTGLGAVGQPVAAVEQGLELAGEQGVVGRHAGSLCKRPAQRPAPIIKKYFDAKNVQINYKEHTVDLQIPVGKRKYTGITFECQDLERFLKSCLKTDEKSISFYHEALNHYNIHHAA